MVVIPESQISMTTTAIDRAWIATELLKIVEAERSLVGDSKARAEAPPDPALSVLYHEIAEQDERHVAILETIATRYGHTPKRSTRGGVGETLGRLKGKVVSMGAAPTDLLRQDLLAKTEANQWQSAWVHTLERIGDAQSAREMTDILNEDQSHQDALLEGLKRMLAQRVSGDEVR
jgi:hypothetical protein